jgi:hypothetical protein
MYAYVVLATLNRKAFQPTGAEALRPPTVGPRDLGHWPATSPRTNTPDHGPGIGASGQCCL